MKIICFVLSFLLLAAIPFNATAQARLEFLEHRYNITIAVECMDEALLQMSRLPGFEMSSQINIANGTGQAVRLVDTRDIDRTLDLLSEMGTVTNSSSSATNNFSVWSGITAEIAVRSQEYDRLMELLYDATTMDEFNHIERRLRQVISDMEWLRGQLNSVEHRIGTAQINISLFEVEEDWLPEPEPEPEAPGRLRRIADAFVSSLRGTLNGAQAVVVFLAYVSLPVVLVAAIAAVVLVICKRRAKKNEKN